MKQVLIALSFAFMAACGNRTPVPQSINAESSAGANDSNHASGCLAMKNNSDCTNFKPGPCLWIGQSCLENRGDLKDFKKLGPLFRFTAQVNHGQVQADNPEWSLLVNKREPGKTFFESFPRFLIKFDFDSDQAQLLLEIDRGNNTYKVHDFTYRLKQTDSCILIAFEHTGPKVMSTYRSKSVDILDFFAKADWIFTMGALVGVSQFEAIFGVNQAKIPLTNWSQFSAAMSALQRDLVFVSPGIKGTVMLLHRFDPLAP